MSLESNEHGALEFESMSQQMKVVAEVRLKISIITLGYKVLMQTYSSMLTMKLSFEKASTICTAKYRPLGLY